MLRANFHTHTTLCDGSSTPEEMARRAALLGFTQLGFSGHMDPDNHMDMNLYRNRIHALQEQYRGKIDILMGIELDTISRMWLVIGGMKAIARCRWMPPLRTFSFWRTGISAAISISWQGATMRRKHRYMIVCTVPLSDILI